MRSRLVPLTLVAGVSFLLPSIATAKPIPIENFQPGDVLVVNSHHTLTYEDLLVLAARDDNGWHLGWFKHKGGGGEEERVPPSADPVALFEPSVPASAASVVNVADVVNGGNPLNEASIAAALDIPMSQTPGIDPQQIPEPGTMLLAALGLAAAARRARPAR